MAAPIFSQNEIDSLIAMPKHVRFDDWEDKWSVRSGNDKASVKAYPALTEDDGVEFLIEREEQKIRGEVFLMFRVKFPQRCHPLCEYHLQRGWHRNPKWFRPRLVPARAFHRHVYNRRAVTDGVPADWCKCAEILDLPVGGSFQQQMDRLTQRFIQDLNVTFLDHAAQQQLFNNR